MLKPQPGLPEFVSQVIEYILLCGNNWIPVILNLLKRVSVIVIKTLALSDMEYAALTDSAGYNIFYT